MQQRNRNGRHSVYLGSAALLLAAACARSSQGVGRQHNGMVFISAQRVIVGTSDQQRGELAERFNCHRTWLGDDLPQRCRRDLGLE